MENRHVSPPRSRIIEGSDVADERIVHGEREQLGVVTERSEEIAEAPGAVADGVTGVRGGNPLMDDHDADGSSGNALHAAGR
jgi:hypothetical protein